MMYAGSKNHLVQTVQATKVLGSSTRTEPNPTHLTAVLAGCCKWQVDALVLLFYNCFSSETERSWNKTRKCA